MPDRILVVEDEEAIARIVVDALEISGYEVTWIAHGRLASERLKRGGIDMVILDAMLPGLDGFAIVRELRGRGDRLPILMLTARGSEPEKVLGFDLGVDDYVTKPFSVLELLGRTRALLRRAQVPEAAPAPVRAARIGQVEVDFARLQVSGALRDVNLPANGFRLLEVLVEAGGRVVPRDELTTKVWGPDAIINTRTIDNLVGKLRQLVEQDPAEPRRLVSVYGVGYQLVNV